MNSKMKAANEQNFEILKGPQIKNASNRSTSKDRRMRTDERPISLVYTIRPFSGLPGHIHSETGAPSTSRALGVPVKRRFRMELHATKGDPVSSQTVYGLLRGSANVQGAVYQERRVLSSSVSAEKRKSSLPTCFLPAYTLWVTGCG